MAHSINSSSENRPFSFGRQPVEDRDQHATQDASQKTNAWVQKIASSD